MKEGIDGENEMKFTQERQTKCEQEKEEMKSLEKIQFFFAS
jgi:hypothetical protein